MMRFLSSFAVTGILVLVSTVADASNLDRAVRAALYGPEVKGISVYGHEWNVKPAHIQKSANSIRITGQISHHRSWQPDDQIYYRFEFRNERLVTAKVNIRRLGWANFVSPISNIVGRYVRIPLPLPSVDDVIGSIDRLASGDWQMAGQKLAFVIGLKAYENKDHRRVIVRDHRRPNERVPARPARP